MQMILENSAGQAGVDCDACVTRRDFLARVAAVAGAAIVAACAGGASDMTGIGTGPLPGGPVTIALANYPGLGTVGQPVELHNASGAAIGVAAVRTGDSTFLALGMSCTHQGTKINIVGQGFVCPNHGAQVASSGAVTNAPASRPLVQRTVVYDAANATLTVL